MKKYVGVLNKVLLYSFFILTIFLLFYNTGRVSTIIIAFLSFLGSIASALIFKSKSINEKYLIWVNIALWLNMFGEFYFYYSISLPYDKILHVTLGIFLAIII